MKKNKENNDIPEEKIPAEEKIDANDWQVVEEENKEQPEQETQEKEPETAPEKDPVEELTKELAQAKEKYLYLQAEYQNFRRRASKDISEARTRAIENTVMPFLAVSDFLAMADAAAEKSDNVEAIRQGLQMIIVQFFKAFDELGIHKFESVGKEFDHNLHDAVSDEASSEVEAGKIIREWSCGFKIGDKLLRPARVVVSSGPEKAAEEENKEGAEQ